MVAFSFIKRIEDKMHPVPMKERIDHASFRLRTQLEKLEHTYMRIHQRDTELFQRCVGAQVANDFAHAKIYANECAEIRKVAKIVLGSQLALERVLLRLETIEEFGDIMKQMAPVMSIVKETKSKIAGVVPQVANELDEVNNLLGDMATETGEVASTDLPIEPTGEDAKKVLEETGLIAEEKLRDHFPVLPTLDLPNNQSSSPVAEAATPGNLQFNGNIDDRVYEYAKMHDGELSVQSCADELRKSPKEVKSALEQLRDTGKIVIE